MTLPYLENSDSIFGKEDYPLHMTYQNYRKVTDITCSNDPKIRKDSVLVKLVKNNIVMMQGYIFSDCGWKGKLLEYYANGKLKSEKHISGCGSKAKPAGVWRFYDVTGKVIKVEKYDKNGDLLPPD
jgi:hypothetical protein